MQTAKKKYKLGKLKEKVFISVMIGIPLIQFLIFYVWMNFNSILMAFNEGPEVIWKNGFMMLGEDVYGWNNFMRIFRNEANVLSVALKNTLLFFAVGTAVTLPISLFVSFFLYKKIPLAGAFRFVFFIPSITTALIYVSGFSTFFEQYGPIWKVCNAIGVEWRNLLDNSTRGVITVIFYSIWVGLGVNMLLYQSAMSRIPEEVIQVARLDGVGWVREMFQLVLPMIWPTLSMTLLLSFTGMFTGGSIVLLFNNEGRLSNMDTISYWIFSRSGESIADVDRNAAAAVGLLFTVVGFPIIMGVRVLLNKLDPDVEF